jgi:hypothetical protein
MIEVTAAPAAEDVQPARPYMPTKAATEDWCTPPEYVDVVKRIFGGTIDLDPASNPWSVVHPTTEIMLPKWAEVVNGAPELVHRAGRGAIIFADGIRTPWGGDVFVNPVYGEGLDDFMDRAVRAAKGDEAANVVMLAPSKTSRRCWQRTVPKAQAVCFLEGRVSYLLPEGERAGATFSSALILWTRDRELVHRFSWYLDGKLGHVMSPR